MNSTITAESQVAALVTERPSRARVFEKYKIDYCCGGEIPVVDACQVKGVSVDQVLDELHQHDASVQRESTLPGWNQAKLADLITHIITRHHDHLRDELPRLIQKTERVAAVHGHTHPETIELLAVLRSVKDEMFEHMGKEEGVLFPWIRGLEEGKGQPPFPGMKMQQPVDCMKHDHEITGKALEKMESLSNGFTPPDDACNTFRVLYAGLKEVQQDIHEHVHKENHILFPKALALAG